MSFRFQRDNRDENAPEIIDALRAAGLEVFEIHRPCDLLVFDPRRDRLRLIEIKNPDYRLKDGGIRSPEKNLRPDQRRLLELNPKDFAIVWTAEEALAFCGVDVTAEEGAS